MDDIDEFRELRGGHSMVADVFADDLGGQVQMRFVGVHNQIPMLLSIWEALQRIEIPRLGELWHDC
jgi:hypothetical protein